MCLSSVINVSSGVAKDLASAKKKDKDDDAMNVDGDGDDDIEKTIRAAVEAAA